MNRIINVKKPCLKLFNCVQIELLVLDCNTCVADTYLTVAREGELFVHMLI